MGRSVPFVLYLFVFLSMSTFSLGRIAFCFVFFLNWLLLFCLFVTLVVFLFKFVVFVLFVASVVFCLFILIRMSTFRKGRMGSW